MRLFKIRDRIYRIKVWVHKRAIKYLPFCHGIYGPCFHRGKRLRQPTAYVDDSRNWVFLCRECAYENDQYWYERWNEYYSGCML